LNKVFRCAVTILGLELISLGLYGSVYFLSKPVKSDEGLVFALCSGSDQDQENYRLYQQNRQGNAKESM